VNSLSKCSVRPAQVKRQLSSSLTKQVAPKTDDEDDEYDEEVSADYGSYDSEIEE
jgi:hypothetical protein